MMSGFGALALVSAASSVPSGENARQHGYGRAELIQMIADLPDGT